MIWSSYLKITLIKIGISRSALLRILLAELRESRPHLRMEVPLNIKMKFPLNVQVHEYIKYLDTQSKAAYE